MFRRDTARRNVRSRDTMQARPGKRCKRCSVEFCNQFPIYADTDYCIGCHERELAKRGDYSYLGDVCDVAPRRGDEMYHHIIIPTQTKRGAA